MPLMSLNEIEEKLERKLDTPFQLNIQNLSVGKKVGLSYDGQMPGIFVEKRHGWDVYSCTLIEAKTTMYKHLNNLRKQTEPALIEFILALKQNNRLPAIAFALAVGIGSWLRTQTTAYKQKGHAA